MIMQKFLKNFKKNSKGITLIALIITIIVLLILAGVSLNAIVGNNGIITNAQNANLKSGMASLEEWLQEEYVKYYDQVSDTSDNKIDLLNKALDYKLLLTDGSRSYILNNGKVYYLLNKSSSVIPKEIKDGLVGGDTTEYSKYTRLQDVYGITKDLKVYYCASDSSVVGKMENYDIDTNEKASGINSNSGLKSAITGILKDTYGVTVGNEVMLSEASLPRDLEIDGKKYGGITDITGIGDLKSLRHLTLSNLTLSSLKGIEGCTNLEYLYLKNTTVDNFTNLANVWGLKYLYIYLPSTIDEITANNQVIKLGDGLKDASNIKELTHFGISGDTIFFDDNITKNWGNPAVYNNGTNILEWTSNAKSNMSLLGKKDSSGVSGLNNFNDSIKKSIQFVYLNNNGFYNIDALKDFSNVKELELMCNSNLSDISAISYLTKLEQLTLHNCNLTSISALKVIKNDKEKNGIIKLTLQGNENLSSLEGIDNSKKMTYLIANNCNLTNIDSLKTLSNIVYLDLAKNKNLVNVKYIQGCKSLNYVYLDNNEKMEMGQVNSAFNGTDTEIGTTKIIKNLKNSYNNFPKKYWELFQGTSVILDYSYSTLGEYLTNDSAKWIKLKGRTDVKKLKLDGQVKLDMEDTNYGIPVVMKTLTGMIGLSMNNMSQLTSIDFVTPVYGENNKIISGMPTLQEFFILGANNSLVNLSALNGCTRLKALYLNNPKIDLSLIQGTINRFGSQEWINLNYIWNWTSGWRVRIWFKFVKG